MDRAISSHRRTRCPDLRETRDRAARHRVVHRRESPRAWRDTLTPWRHSTAAGTLARNGPALPPGEPHGTP
jgi:hypothetical protein